MKKFVLLFYGLLCYVTVYGQQFSQYNTETLFDSFENPSQRSFIRDSSNMIAFNFFIPNFGGNGYLTGNAEKSIRSRLFDQRYDNSELEIGNGKLNYANVNTGIYVFMLKIYTSLKGDQELGFSYKIKGEGNATLTDETFAFFNGGANFEGGLYDNLFNSKGFYQAYHQFGLSYREKVNNRVALGVKGNILLGIQQQRLTINNSYINFDPANNSAVVGMNAIYFRSSNGLNGNDLIPSFRNLGASVSLGGSYLSETGLKWQANVKDVGFIRWGKNAKRITISDSRTFNDLSSPEREAVVRQGLADMLNSGTTKNGSYFTATNGVAEISAAKQFWFNYNNTFGLMPTAILQKQISYPGLAAALVNHVQYNNFVFTVTSSYNDMHLFNVGGQFMYKTPNVEFYLGSERLIPTTRILRKQTDYSGQYAGGDVFMGFSVKFGRLIESHMNASSIPMGEEKGFLGRFFDKLFGKKPKGEL